MEGEEEGIAAAYPEVFVHPKVLRRDRSSGTVRHDSMASWTRAREELACRLKINPAFSRHSNDP